MESSTKDMKKRQSESESNKKKNSPQNNENYFKNVEKELTETFSEKIKEKDNKYFSSPRTKRINSFLFDRTQLIMKLLVVCKEKLTNANEDVLARGLQWLSKEIQESILFKTDDMLIKQLNDFKQENKDYHTVFSWLEQYSTLNIPSKVSNDNFHLKLSSEPDDFELDSEAHALSGKINYINFSEESIKTVDEPTFDIFKLEKEVGPENILSTISCYIFNTMGFYSVIRYDKFESFIQEIAKGYRRDIPYHTDLHAADVLQTSALLVRQGRINEILKFNDIDVCSLLISTIIHDFKHFGRTNLFLINTGHPIATTYNDISVLENYHLAESFAIIRSQEKYNIFSELSKEDCKLMRKRIIECVLATDMTFHAKQFTYLKLKIESHGIVNGENTSKILEGIDKTGVNSIQQEFLNILIHASDISNPTKPFHIYKNWADRVMNEFFSQGDKERELGLPISFLCDRNTVTTAGAQIGFMSGIVQPFMQALREIFPGLQFLIDNLNENKANYTKIKEEDEEKKKKETKSTE